MCIRDRSGVDHVVPARRDHGLTTARIGPHEDNPRTRFGRLDSDGNPGTGVQADTGAVNGPLQRPLTKARAVSKMLAQGDFPSGSGPPEQLGKVNAKLTNRLPGAGPRVEN